MITLAEDAIAGCRTKGSAQGTVALKKAKRMLTSSAERDGNGNYRYRCAIVYLQVVCHSLNATPITERHEKNLIVSDMERFQREEGVNY